MHNPAEHDISNSDTQVYCQNTPDHAMPSQNASSPIDPSYQVSSISTDEYLPEVASYTKDYPAPSSPNVDNISITDAQPLQTIRNPDFTKSEVTQLQTTKRQSLFQLKDLALITQNTKSVNLQSDAPKMHNTNTVFTTSKSKTIECSILPDPSPLPSEDVLPSPQLPPYPPPLPSSFVPFYNKNPVSTNPKSPDPMHEKKDKTVPQHKKPPKYRTKQTSRDKHLNDTPEGDCKKKTIKKRSSHDKNKTRFVHYVGTCVEEYHDPDMKSTDICLNVPLYNFYINSFHTISYDDKTMIVSKPIVDYAFSISINSNYLTFLPSTSVISTLDTEKSYRENIVIYSFHKKSHSLTLKKVLSFIRKIKSTVKLNISTSNITDRNRLLAMSGDSIILARQQNEEEAYYSSHTKGIAGLTLLHRRTVIFTPENCKVIRCEEYHKQEKNILPHSDIKIKSAIIQCSRDDMPSLRTVELSQTHPAVAEKAPGTNVTTSCTKCKDIQTSIEHKRLLEKSIQNHYALNTQLHVHAIFSTTEQKISLCIDNLFPYLGISITKDIMDIHLTKCSYQKTNELHNKCCMQITAENILNIIPLCQMKDVNTERLCTLPLTVLDEHTQSYMGLHAMNNFFIVSCYCHQRDSVVSLSKERLTDDNYIISL